MKHVNVIPASRFNTEETDGYNVWAKLNPEFANDDWIVDRELEELDDELAALGSGYSGHGFNGHDPQSEDPYMQSEISFHGSWSYAMQYGDYDLLDPDPRFDEFDEHDDFLPNSSWDSRYDEPWEYEPFWQMHDERKAQREFDEYLVLLEGDYVREMDAVERELREPDPYERLPFIESMRMGARRSVGYDSYDCRWNRRPYERHMRKRASSGREFELPPIWKQRAQKWQRNKPRSRPFVRDWFKTA